METLISLPQRFSMQKSVPFFLALSFFVLPLSSTAKSICLGLTIVAILLSPVYRSELASLLDRGWCKTSIILFFIVLLACLWSPTTYSQRLLALEKYSKLLYLPILVIGFHEAKARKMAIYAFLAAMFLTSSLAVLKFLGFLPSININPDRLFRNHIMTGYMLDFAAYMAALYAFQHQGWLKRLGYSLLFLLFSYHALFVNGGRMGYIVYLLSMCLLIFQIFSWRKALVGIFMICAASLLIYSQSSFMKERIVLLKTQYEAYQHNDGDNSVGFRFKFHNYAYALFCQHPLIGHGTASFPYNFTRDNPVPGWGHHLKEPHSQYWLMASEFGLIGLIAFLAWLFTLFRASMHLSSTRPLALAMLLSFIVGSITDSLLFYSGSGYFFLLFMALCLSEER
ncbi:Lipid A core-O-antigen ligase [Legionella massiliensis]|uniref:Lipid A core-O-antigen ligase n=1 Tax=Legionella massiliensis TaxID=1034943 RepID=A0A078L4P3_9GAMM|nr:O-antigen ligase family protein [Legionella massiliensis]CDZ78883.1 Lipid A core-O-antigen ligase [Legionella massiliensis]CEE14621.1 O-Antigen ligase [Legionella massiliensis]